jgi:transposase
MERKASPSDVRAEEWALVAPYLTLLLEDAPQREHSLREVFHGLRWIVRAGAVWRMMPQALPPWHTVYPQRHRWLKAGVWAALVHARRAVLRLAQGRKADPAAAIFESRPVPSTPESGLRAGDDGAKRRRGSTVHRAVDTLGHLLAAHVTAANEQDRSPGSALAEKVQEGTGDAGERACVAQGYTGAPAAQDAAAHPMPLEVVKLPEAKKGFVLLPRRGVVERSNAWAARFRRWARDDERLAETRAGLHFVAFTLLMLKRFVE